MLKTTTKQFIDNSDWDSLVMETYGKPYCFQQQYGCQERGNFNITIPLLDYEDEFIDQKEIPIEVNGEIEGINFEVWKNTPEDAFDLDSFSDDLFWDRNYYPDIQMVANDLHAKGLIEAGKYIINIDW